MTSTAYPERYVARRLLRMLAMLLWGLSLGSSSAAVNREVSPWSHVCFDSSIVCLFPYHHQ